MKPGFIFPLSTFLTFLLVAVFATCSPKKTLPVSQTRTMTNYDTLWQNIDSLEQNQLYRSAMDAVLQLQAIARAEGESDQWLKSAVYVGKYATFLGEDELLPAIDSMDQAIAQSSGYERAVLLSLTAEVYSAYLHSAAWRLSGQTQPSASRDKADIASMTATELLERINAYYLKSIENPILRNIPLAEHKMLLEGDASVELRPTMYDLLAHRAIDHFLTDFAFVTDPAYRGRLSDLAMLDPAEEFTRMEIDTVSDQSLKLKALVLFQSLIAFHLNDQSPDALVHADLKRLTYVHSHLTTVEKDSAYEIALMALGNRVENSPAWSEVAHTRAQFLFTRGSEFDLQSGDTTKRWMWRQADEICAQAIERYPESFGAVQCQTLRRALHNKSLHVATEEVWIPGEYHLVQLEYRNTERAYLKVVRMPEDWREVLPRRTDELMAMISSLPVVQEHVVNLVATEDLRPHTTETALQPLERGTYAIVVSDSAQLVPNTNTSFTTLHVSNLTWWAEHDRSDGRLVAVDRKTGKPLAGVMVELYEQLYNSDSRNYAFNRVKSGFTDSEGIFNYGALPSRNRVFPRLIHGKDTLFLENESLYAYYTGRTSQHDMVLLFTDRSIYRPGQEVHYKGYFLHYDTERMPSIVTNRSLSIEFRDVNGQVVKTNEHSSNEFGTFSGTFTAPEGVLTGRMTIQAVGLRGQAAVLIEEYKRPTFEVTIDDPTKTLALGDQVQLTGKAATYSGVPVQDGDVSFRVYRRTVYPWRPWWLGSYFRPADDLEIASGTTKTDNEGKFTVGFIARADAGASWQFYPEFEFVITADVTDIGGETRTGNNTLVLNDQGFRAHLNIPEELDLQSLEKVGVSVENLSGKPVGADVSVKIERVEAPATLRRDRLWQIPDQPVMNSNDYALMFPDYHEPGSERVDQWPLAGDEGNIDVAVTGSDTINLRRLINSPGVYKFTAEFLAETGKSMIQTRYATIYDRQKGEASPHVIWHGSDAASAQPGDTFTHGFLSDHSLTLRYLVDRRSGVKSDWTPIDGAIEKTTTINESDRGGFHIAYNTFFNGRLYTGQCYVNVPWDNKQLEIEYITYRDVTQPGAEEEWMLRISGSEGEAVAAEMAATMYDASLDAFADHSWALGGLFPSYRGELRTQFAGPGIASGRQLAYRPHGGTRQNIHRVIPEFAWFGFPMYGGRRFVMRSGVDAAAPMADGDVMLEEASGMENKQAEASETGRPDLPVQEEQAPAPPSIRTDLQETVFFMPNVYTDDKGRIVLRFKMRESLTRYKFLGIAHTADLKYASTEKEIVSQKDLMVFPQMPRFVRQGDELVLVGRVFNNSDESLEGSVELRLYDAITGESIYSKYIGDTPEKPLQLAPNSSTAIQWPVTVPRSATNPIRYQVIATAGETGDGEEGILPVVTDRIFVTETLAMYSPAESTRIFDFEQLARSHSSAFEPYSLTVEYTSNPAWYAVKALPYLQEYEHQCLEQQFNRLFANQLGRSIIEQNPVIAEVFERWRDSGDTEDMLSQLSKNEELKSAILEETPWVRSAMSEEEQLKQIANLMDPQQLDQEARHTIALIAQSQLSNGGFPWFPGGRDNWYVTQYLVEGFGHLDKLGAMPISQGNELNNTMAQAIRYIDDRVAEYFDDIDRDVKSGKTAWEDNHLSPLIAHYLYARSYFDDIKPARAEVSRYFLGQGAKYWSGQSLYVQGMLYIALTRAGQSKDITDIMLQSFRERSIYDEERGRFWKSDPGYYWYQLPIEQHALFIELFTESEAESSFIDQLRQYLLVHKRTNNWPSTKSTAAAIYALLVHPDSWLEGRPVRVSAGDVELAQEDPWNTGSLYIKETIDGAGIQPSMSRIEVENPNRHASWGGAYFQYFESIDSVQADTGDALQITKSVGTEILTDAGPRFEPINPEGRVEVGDKLIIKLEIKTDREMEFIHLKDMRGSGLEPVNVISGWRWNGGLGYYESTKDLASHFFFENLPRGTWIIQYPVRVTHAGSFSNGIATLQSMYAPEFAAHSGSLRLSAEQSD